MAGTVWKGTEPLCATCGSQRFRYYMWPRDQVVCQDCEEVIDVGWYDKDRNSFREWAARQIVLKRRS